VLSPPAGTSLPFPLTKKTAPTNCKRKEVSLCPTASQLSNLPFPSTLDGAYSPPFPTFYALNLRPSAAITLLQHPRQGGNPPPPPTPAGVLSIVQYFCQPSLRPTSGVRFDLRNNSSTSRRPVTDSCFPSTPSFTSCDGSRLFLLWKPV